MNRILRLIGIILLVLVLVLVVAGVGVVVASNNALNQTYELYEVPELTLPEGDELAELVTEGEHIFVSRGCASCHGSNGGGALMIDDPAFGTIYGSNLTSGAGGVAEIYASTGDWIRAIQHGVRPDGKGLIIMPSQSMGLMREAEMQALLAYIQSLDPVDNEFDAVTLGPIARIFVAIGEFDATPNLVDHENVQLSQVEKAPTVEYGTTLIGICADCHGGNLGGAFDPGGADWSPNLTGHENGFVGQHDLDAFLTTLRTGQLPDGSVLNAELMPYQYFGQMDDIELEAIYQYLASVEADNPQE